MIQQESRLCAADNTNTREIQCIRALGGLTRRFADTGDTTAAIVKEVAPDGNVKVGEIVRAVIVRMKKETCCPNGSYTSFDENTAVIIKADGEPKGARIFGPVVCELRDRKSMKIVLLAPEVI